MAQIGRLVGLPVPRPFLLAIFLQESGGLHFRVPSGDNADNFIVVGLDHGDHGRPDRITSRGYGIGQFTLFHHPPTATEVATVMVDPVKNVQRAVKELRSKYELFVAGSTSGQQADDRIREIGDRRRSGPAASRPDDRRYMTDCARCAAEHLVDIRAGAPVYRGATTRCIRPSTTRRRPTPGCRTGRSSAATGPMRCGATTAPA